MRSRLWAGRAALALFGAGLGLGGLELACRILFMRRAEGFAASSGEAYYYHDLDGRRRHLPGKVGRGASWDGRGEVEYRVNALGFLDRELESPKPAGERRILFLGDSVVMAGGLRREDTFVERLQASLGVEVVNAGVGDSGVSESLEDLRESGWKAEPDAVVLGVYLNDSRPPQGFADETLFEHPFLSAVRSSRLLRSSYLANFLAYRLLHRRAAEFASSPAVSRRFEWVDAYRRRDWETEPAALRVLVEQARFDWGAAWRREEMERLILAIGAARAQCSARRVPFGVVLFPVDVQLRSRARWDALARPQAALARYLTEAGVPHADLLESFRGKARPDWYYDHCHLTPEGHRAAADALEPLLRTLLDR